MNQHHALHDDGVHKTEHKTKKSYASPQLFDLDVTKNTEGKLFNMPTEGTTPGALNSGS